MSHHPHTPAQDIYELALTHQQPGLNKVHLTYTDIEPALTQLRAHPAVTATTLGKSYLGVPITRFTLGSGPLTLLAWTQMHGDEPTATAAVIDWLTMLLHQPPTSLPQDWRSLVTLHVIPMLNPDGASMRTRVNAQGIDINRDALTLQSPEGNLLLEQVKTLKPDVAFNLHDQNPYYTVGNSAQPATLAFLAPAFHEDKYVDAPRLRAKQLIAHMHKTLIHWLPQGMARYDDTYSRRSFGDNIAALGASTILIESGAHRNDPHRQTARHLNVVALQSALEAMLTGQFRHYSMADYYAIPENTEEGLVDLKITGVTQQAKGCSPFVCDIAINCDRKTGGCEINAVGDLSVVHGFEELDGTGMRVLPVKGQEVTMALSLDDDAYRDLLRQGVGYFYGETEKLTVTTSLPVKIFNAALPTRPCPLPKDEAIVLLGNDTPRIAIIGTTRIAL